MEVEDKLIKLGYTISTCENRRIGSKLLNNAYIHIIIIDGKIDDYDVRGNLFIKEQSDIDNIQTAYNALKSDLKELKMTKEELKITSKEALEHIIFEAKAEKPIFSMYYQEFLRPIEKDLEILEIIKKHKLLNYVLKNEKCANMYHLSKEEIDLLREIENE